MIGTWLAVQLNNEVISDYEVTWANYSGQLSRPEALSVKILSSQSLQELSKALNQNIGVTLQNAEQSCDSTLKLFKLKALVGEEVTTGLQSFLLELRAPVFDLTRSRVTPILKNVSLAQACDLILTGRFSNKLSSTLQPYRFEVVNADLDQPLPLIKGLNESLFSFFQRILSVHGLSYYFDHTNKGMMVISDEVAKFGTGIRILENNYAAGELLTVPHYEQKRQINGVSSNEVIAAGHPHTQPEVLVSSLSQGKTKSGGAYQADFNEFNQSEASSHANLMLLAKQGFANHNHYIGGGIVFPGMIEGTLQELLVKTNFTLEFDGHERERIRALPMQAESQSLQFPYRDEPLLESHSMLFHGGTISDISGSPTESVSVSSEGHYNVLLPDFVLDNQSSTPMRDTRMVYPMQSDDHSQHFTLMNNSEGLLLYNAGKLGESLLLGTGNSGGASHITNSDTAQNAYWQDASQNKTAFVNQGNFDRNQSTGRQTAHIMEAPNYHPDGSSSYVRMGDSVQNDSSYPSQASETGMLMATTGHYQEEHQSGLLHLSVDTGSDPSNPLPVNREMTQLNPIGTPDILQTSTANLHNDLKTSDTVTHLSQMTQGTLEESLLSPTLFNTWSNDNTKQIFVNQNLQQNGDTSDSTLNTQNTNLTITAKNVTQTGTLRTDQYTTKNLIRQHTQNLENYQTLLKSVSQGQEQITSQNFAVQNHTRSTQQGAIQYKNLGMNAGNFNSNASTNINSMIMGGGGSSSQNAAILSAQAANAANLKQQKATQKKEILFMIDDPDGLIQTPPHLSVNNLNPTPLSANSVTTYPLSDEQKEGSIALNLPTQNGTVTSPLHEQIRRINIQQETS